MTRQWPSGNYGMYSRVCILCLLFLDVLALAAVVLIVSYTVSDIASSELSSLTLQTSLLWIIMARTLGLYDPQQYHSYQKLTRINCVTAVAVILLMSALTHWLSYGWSLLFSIAYPFLCIFLVGLVLRSVLLAVYHYMLRKQPQRVLVLGKGRRAKLLVHYLDQQYARGLLVDSFPLLEQSQDERQWLNALDRYCIREEVKTIYLADSLPPEMVQKVRNLADDHYIYFHQLSRYVAGHDQQLRPRQLDDDILVYTCKQHTKWLPPPPISQDRRHPQLKVQG